MQDQKNLIFALVLSCVILFGWQYFYAEPKLQEAQRQAEIAKLEQAKQATAPVPTDAANAPQGITPVLNRTDVLPKNPRIKIKSNTLHGSISLKGARFDDLTLGQYKIENNAESGDVVLLSPSGSDSVYFAEFGWVSANQAAVPNAETLWSSNDTVLTKDKPINLSWDNGQGLRFFINIALDEHYMFTVSRSVENYGGASANLMPYGLVNRARAEHSNEVYILHEGALGVLDDVLSEVTFKHLKEDKKHEFKNSKGWVGLTDKYWFTAMIPDQGNSFDANYTYFFSNERDRYQVDYRGQGVDVAPGKTVQTVSHFFAGAKEIGLLDTYREKLGIPLFDRAVDFGYLYFITKPIFKLLTLFHTLVGNFGLAILLLTVLIKLFLFPLANKSYVSMYHLKRLQPQLMELKERYKTDKMQLNKAMMDLYREEKVNPMSGCLPLLIQIPIFFALYKVLYVTIEMRHAPFYGWISDLSAPDPTTIFNLFGLLPFHNLPQLLMVGVWPLVMGLTMYLQQRMNPAPSDPVQAKIMKALPFIFTFLFASFPAGLVIYWAWNNSLSIAQQWIITRKLPK